MQRTGGVLPASGEWQTVATPISDHLAIRLADDRLCDPTTPLGLPDYQPHLVFGSAVNGERSESEGREAPLTADPETEHS
jgi:hypothetical protein